MPATRSELAVYDAQHRARQVDFGAVIAAYVLAQWFRLIDPLDIKGTALAWLNLVLPRIRELYDQSALDAISYVEQIRRLQVPDAEPIIFGQPTFELGKVQNSLLIMGPKNLALKQLRIPKEPLDPDPALADSNRRLVELKALAVNRLVADQVAGEAVRHVRNGGRDAVDLAVAKDPVALGWVRVTAPGACAFCLMLSSRKAVYGEDSFVESNIRFSGTPGGGDYKVHSRCACTLRPVWSRDPEEIPQQALDAEDLWKRTGAKFSGKDALNAFRRAVENR